MLVIIKNELWRNDRQMFLDIKPNVFVFDFAQPTRVRYKNHKDIDEKSPQGLVWWLVIYHNIWIAKRNNNIKF